MGFVVVVVCFILVFVGWFFSTVPTGWRGCFLVEANEIAMVTPPIERQITGATLGFYFFAGII